VDNVTAFKRTLGKWDIKHSMVMCSGSKTDYKSSEPHKTLVMLSGLERIPTTVNALVMIWLLFLV